MQDAAVKYKTVLAAVKREHGFPVTDGRVQCLALFLGDVWRIARDKIKILHPERGRRESVRLQRNRTRIKTVQGDILACNGKCFGAYIGKDDARLWEIDAQRTADASGVPIHPSNALPVGTSGALRDQTPGFNRVFLHAGLFERAAHGEIQLIIGLCQSKPLFFTRRPSLLLPGERA